MTDYKLMPVEPTKDMLSRVMSIVTGFSGPYGEFNDYLDEETAREVYEAFTTDAPVVQGEPVGRVKTVGGYPDCSEHTFDWLCKHKDIKDGDLLYTAPQPVGDAEKKAIEDFCNYLLNEWKLGLSDQRIAYFKQAHHDSRGEDV